MGTRCDMYVGKGKDAEWIGSIAFDGYRDGIDEAVLKATTEEEFRTAFAEFVKRRDDYTSPEMGWPWPWDTSETSDCSYWFFDGKVWDEGGEYGTPTYYRPCDVAEPDGDEAEAAMRVKYGANIIEFPDMSARKNVTLGERSGIMILTERGSLK